MNTLIVYESQYGNTKHVAELAGEELKAHGPVRVVSIAHYQPAFLEGVDLVLVGGPTQAHGATAHMHEFMNRFVSDPKGIASAAFDTRLSGPIILTGSRS